MQAAFMDSFGKTVRLHRSEFGPLPAILNPETRRLALFGHPLWRTEPEYWEAEQVLTSERGREESGAQQVRAFDFLALARRPMDVFAWLVSATE